VTARARRRPAGVAAGWLLAAGVFLSASDGRGDEDGESFAYALPEAGYVTLVIEDAQGRRVRNLVGGVPRPAGRSVERWDGLDDAGRPAPPGEYRWRGLARGEISAHFFGAFNSPGTPPWNTLQHKAGWYLRASGSGGWLSDHERPLCLHADGERVFIGAAIAEAGHAIVQAGPDGRKQWGTLWLSLSGAHAIATEGDILYVAGEKGWMGEHLAVNRLSLKTHGWIGNPPDVKKRRTDACFVKEKSADFSGIRGMVITPRGMVLSLADRDRLAVFDRETAAHVRDVPLPGAGAIVKLNDGGVLGLSGRTVVRVDLEQGRHRSVVAQELIRPSGLGVDSTGRIYVSDIDPSEQCVKVFSPEGRLMSRIGRPGGRREGRFDPLAMSQPVALALDSRDQVWVAEHDFLPKRVSVWGGDGKLVRDMIGPPHYGGGGALDPAAPRKPGWLFGLGRGAAASGGALRAFYKGMVFTVRPWPETATLESVLFRPEEHPDLPYPAKDEAIPHFPVYRDGRLYLVNDAGYGVPGVFIGEVVKDHLVPRVIFGGLDTLWKTWQGKQDVFLRTIGPADKPAPQGVFLWQDADGDGRAAPGEVTVRTGWRFGAMWAMRSWPTLRLYAREGDRRLAILEPVAEAGAPVYDLKAARFLSLPEETLRKGFCASAPDLAGNLLINCGGGGNQGDRFNTLLSLAPDGSVRWSYPNPYPANWHNSPKPLEGEIQHTLNVEGSVLVDGGAGEVFQLNGNKGVRYLFTADGLFVARLFGDAREVPLQQNLSEASPGMRLDGHSLGDECFSGWFGRVADGRILQIVGKDASNVAEVRGLQTLTRLAGGTLRIATPAKPRADRPAAERGPVTAIQAAGFGFTAGWEELAPQAFPAGEPVARFAIGYRASGLRLWLSVKDDTPFENGGGDPNTLFHSGDAVDFRWAADPALPPDRGRPGRGDQRFVIAMHRGVPAVIRYTYVAEGGTEAPVVFASPAGTERVARVERIDGAKAEVTRDGKGYTLTLDLAWAHLGLAAAPSGVMRGDVGVIFGDPSGQRAVRRCYYFDPGSQEVSDMPSEVRVSPSRWGSIRF